MGELKFFGAPEFTQLNSYSHVKNMSVVSVFLQPLVGRVLTYHISTLHEALSFLKDMTWFHGPSCKTWNDRMCSVNYVVGNSESCSPSPAGVSQSSPGWHDTFISAIFSNLKRHFSTGILGGGGCMPMNITNIKPMIHHHHFQVPC